MNDEAIQYLDSNRKIVIELDLNNLVNETIKRYDFLKKTILEKCGKNLPVPDVTFNTEEREHLQVTLSWFNESYHLDFEVLDRRSSSFIYYCDMTEIPHKTTDKWTDLDKDSLDWLVDKLLLFTE